MRRAEALAILLCACGPSELAMPRTWNATEVTQGYTRVALDPAWAHDTAPPGPPATGLRQGCQNRGPNYWLLDPFARHVLTTDAPNIIVETVHDLDVIADAGWDSSGCLVNGSPRGDGAYCASLGGPTLTTYSGLPVGTNTIELIHGPATHLTPGAALRGMPVIAVRIPLGYSYSIVMPSAPAVRVLVQGTSITVGARVTAGPNASATYQGAWMLARKNMLASSSGALAGARLTVSAASQEKWFDVADAAVRAAAVAKIATQLNGTSANYLIIDGYELNDWGAALQTAAAFGTMVGAYLDAVHTALPSALVVAITAITYTSEGVANGQGATLGDLRTQVANACAARATYCTTIAGPPLVSAGNYSDTGHPNTAGHTEKQVNVRAALVAAGIGY